MDKLEIAIEAVNLYFEENITAKKAIKKAEKECFGVDQNNQSTNKNIVENIITQEER
ncbi:hypothetical protein K5V21_06260 [Clostridium sardiniense]|uniref:Uncharacterized protein n=1 Tax=Clostridium sardiniense TaxID=29369 RepID=A0ABS7KW57_CLOSR|nr:hypothetical protein [Clostridium sardiniense]MBY0755055.1 hypothetical protein [Clostridium sardiniense]MDQ0459088.1 hypothetical protein [Clostridium sardiniense]